MRRRFFRSFKVRIPRKLKKAARYVLKDVYIQRQKRRKLPLVIHLSIYNERIEYVIAGRHTKWKARARFAVIKEDKRRLAYMWA